MDLIRQQTAQTWNNLHPLCMKRPGSRPTFESLDIEPDQLDRGPVDFEFRDFAAGSQRRHDFILEHLDGDAKAEDACADKDKYDCRDNDDPPLHRMHRDPIVPTVSWACNFD